ncbi:MAG TPA: tRNA pseudouridine(38-40) synthase TruA [Ignavibacteriales bacterium]|nr:tRNA pseudouridine(38-40) synthase TruA [Ignavibacteriales bacterium]
MNNYKLTIQYDGTAYAGWQIQDNAGTIQETISGSIEVILKEKVNLIGSGRTDAGVHALGQAANFRTKQEIDIFRFQHSLNSILPTDISVIRMKKVPEKFHSRFDAKSRNYLYLISKIKSPFYYKYSIQKKDLNINTFNKLSKEFLGKKDFTSFCRKNSEADNKFCEIKSIGWKETKEFYLFLISADRFLHGMVRTIVGTLFQAADKNRDEKFIRNVFEQFNREAAGEAVPAKGLFLYKVSY